MHEIGAASRMRGLAARVDDADQLVLFGVDDGDAVARIGRHQEVAAALVEAAVMQEALGLDRGDLQVLDVAVVDEQDLARLLDVDDEGPD